MEEKKLKLMRLVAMLLSIVGSAVLLSSLLMEFCSFTDPIVGVKTISMIDYVDARIMVVFGLVELCCVLSLMRFSISQIITGAFIGIWAGFMLWDFHIKATESMESITARLGLGIIMFIISAGHILASGIIFAFFENKCKALEFDSGKPRLIRKIEVFYCISLGVILMICCVLEFLKHIR